MVAGVVAGALSVAYLPWHVTQLEKVERRVQLDGVLYRHLQRAAEAPRVRAAFAQLRAAEHRRPPPDPVPALLARRRAGLGRHGRQRREPDGPHAVAAAPQQHDAPDLQSPTFPTVEPPDNFVRIYRNRSWRVYAEPGCVPPGALA